MINSFEIASLKNDAKEEMEFHVLRAEDVAGLWSAFDFAENQGGGQNASNWREVARAFHTLQNFACDVNDGEGMAEFGQFRERARAFSWRCRLALQTA